MFISSPFFGGVDHKIPLRAPTFHAHENLLLHARSSRRQTPNHHDHITLPEQIHPVTNGRLRPDDCL